MRGIRLLVTLIFVVGQFAMFTPTVRADIEDTVVISQLYLGAPGLAAQEFVEIYNNSPDPLVVTDWCIYYIPASNTSARELGCLEAPDSQTDLVIEPGGTALFASAEYPVGVHIPDVLFSAGIAAAGGHIVLVDHDDNELDRLGWGGAEEPETTTVLAPEDGKSLVRKMTGVLAQDTNVNADDFVQEDPLVHASGVSEEPRVFDMCPNIELAQAEVPAGYAQDEEGDCQADSCLNIEGLQISVPDGFDSTEAGECSLHDECDNIEGAQATIPEYMIRGESNSCVVVYAPLLLTEILPNAEGSDTGNEFIEIYNPGDVMLNLTMYAIKIDEKFYSFPIGSTIKAKEYEAFSDTDMKLTLVNTSGRVLLFAAGSDILGDTGVYESAEDGESWALISGIWQYTNRPTPGAENLKSILEEDGDVESTSSLKPCRTDQFRNPETNRCKKIEVSSLTPCVSGQYRNPETNRCRSTATVSDLKPCAENQYRSEETNRCRNKEGSVLPEAAFKVQPVDNADEAFAGWLALGGVGAVAGGYAGWEWRRELANGWRRLFGLFKK